MLIIDKLNKNLLNEYKEKRGLYEDYCFTIKNLVESLLKNKGYKYHITSRTKDLDKLKKKIEQKKKLGKVYRRLGDIEDLAGIRVVFYLEKDKRKFAKELNEEISLKLQFQENTKKSGYRALHTIVSLGPKRKFLSEYKRYKNLKCEIQLTSILYHAWSEMEHDIFYKENEEVKKMNKKNKLKLKSQLLEIMNDHIKQATQKLEKIINQIKNSKK